MSWLIKNHHVFVYLLLAGQLLTAKQEATSQALQIETLQGISDDVVLYVKKGKAVYSC